MYRVQIFFVCFFCFSVWGTFPCYFLHFGAITCTLLNFKGLNLPFELFIDFSMMFIYLPTVFINFPLLTVFIDFSRMRSKGSRFTLGVWGLRVCSLDVAFTTETVCNRSQPSNNRSHTKKEKTRKSNNFKLDELHS
jgi:hypothetical protein